MYNKTKLSSSRALLLRVRRGLVSDNKSPFHWWIRTKRVSFTGDSFSGGWFRDFFNHRVQPCTFRQDVELLFRPPFEASLVKLVILLEEFSPNFMRFEPERKASEEHKKQRTFIDRHTPKIFLRPSWVHTEGLMFLFHEVYEGVAQNPVQAVDIKKSFKRPLRWRRCVSHVVLYNRHSHK